VIVRFLTHDDSAQAAAAVRVMKSLTSDSPGFLSLIVIAEMVWVLKISYHFTNKEIALALEGLLRSKELVIERAEIVSHALHKFRYGHAGFTDCLIERCGHAADCEHTVTFDKKAASGAGMRLIS
jgi:predicted nucleic-acid-binding protein